MPRLLSYELQLCACGKLCIPFSVSNNLLHVLLRPADHVLHQREEGVGAWGEVVLYSWRYFGEYLTTDEAILFERSECLCE